MKRLRNWIQAEAGGLLLSILLRLLYWSMRWAPHPLLQNDAIAMKAPRIYTFWHNRQVMMPCLCRTAIRRGKISRVSTLISAHRDGRLIAKAISYLGLDSIAGSSTRGGVEALTKMIKCLRSGSDLAVTPDGPRGPIYKVKLGALKAAQKSSVPIFPCAYAASSFWRLKSWDQMIIPKPFSRGIALVGEPLQVPANSSDEDLQRIAERLERRLIAITEKADQAVLKNNKV